MNDSVTRDRRLAEPLAGLLSDSYSLYVLTQNYHWNVEGPHFQSLHTLFEEQYTELAMAIDQIAEVIRALGFYAPGTFAQFSQRSRVKLAEDVPPAEEMVQRLEAAHGVVEQRLGEIAPIASEMGDEVVGDLVVQRLAVHSKARWMLRSVIGGGSAHLS